jgi:16S rRNA (uracil1498-N3)-methyltransferase
MNSEHNWFYVPPEHISKSNIVIPKDSAHYIVHVLRKKKDQAITITDGQGRLYKARFVDIKRSSCKAEILEKMETPVPEPPYVDLAFVPLKGSRTETVIEKGKELGVRRFLLFISQHAVVKQMTNAKIDRFRHVMISAMVQSRQCVLSPVLALSDLHSLVQKFRGYDRVLVADPDGSKEASMTGDSILLVVGPEGGFDRDELFLFDQAGAKRLSLGIKRLRSETAAITGLVKVMVANNII